MSKIKTSELQKEFFVTLGELLKSDGFRRRISQQDYCRKFEDGMQSVHLAFIHHVGDVDAVVDVGVRFDDVENILNESRKLLTKAEKAQTFTLGVELGNFVGEGQKRWKLINQEDVQERVNSMYDFICEHGLPHIEKLSEQEFAYAILRGDDKQSRLNCAFNDSRAKAAIAMAIVLGRSKSEIHELIEYKRSYLISKEERMIDNFESFILQVQRKI